MQIIRIRSFKYSINAPFLAWSFILGTAFVLYYYLYFPLVQAVNCPFKSLTGIPCPTCGGTHFVYFLMHKQFDKAFTANPGLFVETIIFMLLFFFFSMASLFGFYLKIHFSEQGARSLRWILLLFIVIHWGILLILGE